MRFDIKLAGLGGQGILFAGIVLGAAAALYEGKQAVMTSNYGPEARGGESFADVIISDEKICYPKVIRADLLVAMSREGYENFSHSVKPDGIIIVDKDLVKVEPKPNTYMTPATKIAEKLGSRIVANMVLLGFTSAKTGIVSFEALKKAVEKFSPPEFVGLNLKALEAGRRQALEVEGFRQEV